MTLKIIQSTALTETVSANVIYKLYYLLSLGMIDANSVLEGRITTSVTYKNYVNALTARFPNLYITATSYYLTFKNSNIKSACISQFGTSGDTEMTETQGNAVTSIPEKMFYQNTSIGDFSDLAENFPNCTTIDKQAFAESSLTKIDLSRVTTLKNQAFNLCTSLTEIGNVESITSISGYNHFGQCTGLSDVVFHFKNWVNTYKNYDGGIFSGGYNAPATYPKVAQVYCPKLKYGRYNGKWKNYVNNNSLWAFLKTNLLYLRDIEKLYPGDLYIYSNLSTVSNQQNNIAIVINNSTPPTIYNESEIADSAVNTSNNEQWWYKVLGDKYATATIYVPDAAISTYQNHAQWGAIGTNNGGTGPTFAGISTLTQYATEAAWIAAGRPALGLITEYM